MKRLFYLVLIVLFSSCVTLQYTDDVYYTTSEYCNPQPTSVAVVTNYQQPYNTYLTTVIYDSYYYGFNNIHWHYRYYYRPIFTYHYNPFVYYNTWNWNYNWYYPYSYYYNPYMWNPWGYASHYSWRPTHHHPNRHGNDFDYVYWHNNGNHHNAHTTATTFGHRDGKQISVGGQTNGRVEKPNVQTIQNPTVTNSRISTKVQKPNTIQRVETTRPVQTQTTNPSTSKIPQTQTQSRTVVPNNHNTQQGNSRTIYRYDQKPTTISRPTYQQPIRNQAVPQPNRSPYTRPQTQPSRYNSTPQYRQPSTSRASTTNTRTSTTNQSSTKR